VPIVSPKLGALLREKCPKDAELFPIQVLSPQGKVLAADYLALNPLAVDCLDLEKCEPTWYQLASDSIESVKRLVIDEARVPADKQLFRVTGSSAFIVLRRELAEAIEAAKCTGVRFRLPRR
jgi:hypothetical protein